MERLLGPLRLILASRHLLALFACSFLMGVASSFVGPFFSIFGTIEARMSELRFGVFMTVTSLSAIAVSTALAHWSDTRCSRRAMLLAGSLTGCLGFVGYAYVRSFWGLTAIGSTVLALSSITFSQLFALAREQIGRAGIPAGEAPLYINVLRLCLALAWTVGPAVASWVMIEYGFRGTFLVAAACYALLMLVVWIWLPGEAPGGGGARRRDVPLREVFARPGLLPHFIGFILVFMCGTIGMMNLPLLILRDLGGTEANVGITYSVAPFFELPFMFYLGLLASRTDQARLIRGAVGLAVIYYAALSLVQAPWHVYPVQALSAIITAVTSGVAITFFQNYLPDQVGTATNLYATATRIGSTAGYLLFGSLAEWLGYRPVFYVCTALSVAALFILHRYRPRSPLAAA